jgi:hypothetical protein
VRAPLVRVVDDSWWFMPLGRSRGEVTKVGIEAVVVGVERQPPVVVEASSRWCCLMTSMW